MNIIWISYKRADKDLDWATWLNMITGLSKMGHSVNLVIPRTRKNIDFEDKGNIIYLPALHWRIACTFSFSISLLLYLTVDILLHKPHNLPDGSQVVLMDSFALFPCLPFFLLSKIGLIKTKFVLDVRSLPVETKNLRGWVKRGLHIMSLYGAKFLVNGATVISPSMRKYISDKYNIPENKIGMWSSGVSLDLFEPKAHQPLADNPDNRKPAEDLTIPEEKFIVMYHGAFSSNRGLQETIQAIRLVKEKYSNIFLLLVGNGNANRELYVLVKKLNLENHVLIHKPVSYKEIPDYISVCDVGILPFPYLIQWRTSSPLKLLEYLAMEKPVIVTDIEAHRDVLKDSPCGIFIKSDKPEEIARGIISAYKKRKELKKIGKSGRQLVQEYTWDKQAQRLSEYLERIC